LDVYFKLQFKKTKSNGKEIYYAGPGAPGFERRQV
jgi:hypothetical protein